jgi:hypothetical protein
VILGLPTSWRRHHGLPAPRRCLSLQHRPARGCWPVGPRFFRDLMSEESRIHPGRPIHPVDLLRRGGLLRRQRRKLARRRWSLRGRLGGISGAGLCRLLACRQGERWPTW